MGALNGLDNLAVAIATGLLDYFTTVLGNLDVVFKSTGGEVERVPEAVPRLGRVFPYQVWRRMTVITDSHGPVRRLDPGTVFPVHDVTVGTGLRIVGEVGPSLGVGERVCAGARSYAKYATEKNSLRLAKPHRAISCARPGLEFDRDYFVALGALVAFLLQVMTLISESSETA